MILSAKHLLVAVELSDDDVSERILLGTRCIVTIGIEFQRKYEGIWRRGVELLNEVGEGR